MHSLLLSNVYQCKVKNINSIDISVKKLIRGTIETKLLISHIKLKRIIYFGIIFCLQISHSL